MNVGFMNVGFMNVGIVNVGIMNVGMWLLERSCGHRQRPKHRASQVLIQVKSAVNEMKLADKKLYLRNQLVCVLFIYITAYGMKWHKCHALLLHLNLLILLEYNGYMINVRSYNNNIT